MDDRKMLILVEEILDHELTLSPEVLHMMLLRMRELLTSETAKRPSHRPRDDTGELVANLHEACGDLAKAKRLVAKMKKKPVRTVAKAYERYQKQKRQK
jgi:hypothetical protein